MHRPYCLRGTQTPSRDNGEHDSRDSFATTADCGLGLRDLVLGLWVLGASGVPRQRRDSAATALRQLVALWYRDWLARRVIMFSDVY